MSHYKPYGAYRDSGSAWLGSIPKHWEVKRLRHLASFANSNVDKKSQDGEQAVRLCNYTDVYYNEFIHADLDFMPATATEGQAEAFGLRAGDVIITKDSEDPRDIGIPAFVPETIPGVVCGYHLTLIRANHPESAQFVFRVLQSNPSKGYFYIGAPGITRFGLGQDVIGDLPIALPPVSERARISDWIQSEAARIDSLIEKKTLFIDLLKQRRQALITQAVTKGLDPGVKLRDSGVEWIGEVPEHWEVISIGYVLDAVGDVDHFMPKSVEKGVPYLMTGDLKELASNVNMEDCKQVSHQDYAKLSKRIKSSKGDVIIARYATIGTSMYVDIDTDFLVSYSCVTVKPNTSKVSGIYLFQYLKSDAFYHGINNQINTNTQGNVGINDLKKVQMVLPNLLEQSRIIEYLNSKLINIDSLAEKTQRSINLLKERRTALITAAVTGQIDLREDIA